MELDLLSNSGHLGFLVMAYQKIVHIMEVEGPRTWLSVRDYLLISVFYCQTVKRAVEHGFIQ